MEHLHRKFSFLWHEWYTCHQRRNRKRSCYKDFVFKILFLICSEWIRAAALKHFCPLPSQCDSADLDLPHCCLDLLLIHTLFTVFCNTKSYRFFPCCWLLIPEMYHGGRFHHTPRLQRVFSTIERLSFLKRKSRLSRRPFIASKGVYHLESIVHHKH